MNNLSLAAAAAFALVAAAPPRPPPPPPRLPPSCRDFADPMAASSANKGSADSNSMHSLNQNSLRAQLKQNLSKSGFTDIKIMPSSFYVQAKNKKGEPVAMVIGPDTFTAVTEIKAPGANNSQASNKPQASSTQSQTKKD